MNCGVVTIRSVLRRPAAHELGRRRSARSSGAERGASSPRGRRRRGRPHLVPFCFALEGETLYSAVDEKPKQSKRLKRLENIRSRPDVAPTVTLESLVSGRGKSSSTRSTGREARISSASVARCATPSWLRSREAAARRYPSPRALACRHRSDRGLALRRRHEAAGAAQAATRSRSRSSASAPGNRGARALALAGSGVENSRTPSRPSRRG